MFSGEISLGAVQELHSIYGFLMGRVSATSNSLVVALQIKRVHMARGICTAWMALLSLACATKLLAMATFVATKVRPHSEQWNRHGPFVAFLSLVCFGVTHWCWCALHAASVECRCLRRWCWETLEGALTISSWDYCSEKKMYYSLALSGHVDLFLAAKDSFIFNDI